MRIGTILPDDGAAFTDRLFGPRGRPATGPHAFDEPRAALGIEHRPTPPGSPGPTAG